MIWPAPNEVKITEPSVSISRSIRWPEPGRPASSVKAGLRPPPAAAAALTELAARPLLATMESTTMSGARNDCNSTFTEASYTKYLTFPIDLFRLYSFPSIRHSDITKNFRAIEAVCLAAHFGDGERRFHAMVSRHFARS